MTAHMFTIRRLAFPVALLATGFCLTAPARAEGPPPHPFISVTGEGRAAIAPDMAMLSLTVTRVGETAEAALAANSAAMRQVIEALKADGMAERDIQTSDFSIFPRYSQPDPTRQGGSEQQPQIIGYQVSNGVTLRVRDITKLGAILDRSVTLGVNQGGQITFTNADPAKAVEEARRKAVMDAMAKARVLAEAAGLALGPVMSISENAAQPEPMPLMRTMAMAKEVSPVPIAGGENTYAVTVDMRFDLRPKP
ncbi:SIMPL domain-containing protein [Allorhizobium pseudoryzae]|uniref:SIMPL domain-containing protein n=1 Tax=Allorhizobium pseudoryzae TaxID=379684 RepID=UPI003D0162BB